MEQIGIPSLDQSKGPSHSKTYDCMEKRVGQQ